MNANYPISKIMTTDLVTVRQDDTIHKIREIFNTNDFHHIPVVDAGEKLAGIISKEDFYRFSYILSLQTTGRTYSELNYQHLLAKDIMTKYPICLDPDDTIGLAADIFLANKLHALPILEDGTLLGIVTTHDLLKFSFDLSQLAEDTVELNE